MTSAISWAVSVRGRLTVAVTVLFAAVVFFGSWFLLNRAEAAWVDDLQAQDLAELEMLAADLQAIEAAGPGFGVPVVPLPVGIDGTTFTLTDGTGVIVGATPVEVFTSRGIAGHIPLAAVPDAIIESGAAFLESEAIGAVVSVSLPVDLEQGTLTLVASSSLAPIDAGVDALRNTLWLVAPLLVAALGVLAWVVTGRAFQPVAAITDQVERITDERLDERVPVPQSRDEVAHLARTMNTMLDRLSTSRQQQRQFVSDASHELRNPIATSKAKLEVGLAYKVDTDWEETARVVLEEQDRLGNLVDDLLLLARLGENQQRCRDEVDLDDIVFTEAGRSHSIPIDIAEVEPVRIHGDQRQLVRLVRNLIDNATRYATKQAVVTLEQDQREAVLVVEDDGPGIREEDRRRVLKRFVRSDDARTRTYGGAGLGLAIVQGIATGHDGTVTISEAEGGGARVEVRLPGNADS